MRLQLTVRVLSLRALKALPRFLPKPNANSKINFDIHCLPMSQLLLYYQRPEPATWVFLSSFLLFGVYFVFHRFWSLRNLDLILLILLAPGLMMVYEGRRMRADEVRPVSTGKLVSVWQQDVQQNNQAMNNALQNPEGKLISPSEEITKPTVESWDGEKLEFYGFTFLLSACGMLLIRMLIDPAIVRRPLLEPNLSIGGLCFIGVSLLMFLLANVITSDPRLQTEHGPPLGPGYALLNMLPELPTTPGTDVAEWERPPLTSPWLPNLARIIAIAANLSIVFGIVGVGYWHFDNIKTGIGAATMYLLLPYTAQMTGNVQHALPAALLVLAILSYRLPLLAGMLLGAGAGLVYYPFFLLPLWISFYWHRGLGRLLSGVGISLAVLTILLLLGGVEAFWAHLQKMFGLWLPSMEGLEGVWGSGIPAFFRLPVLVGFIILSLSFLFWPARKNLGTLMCGSAALMLAAQFWHGYGGGLYMAWFLPPVLLTIFRPNVDDRIASKVVQLNWIGGTKTNSTPGTPQSSAS